MLPRARDMRKNPTRSEAILWSALRGRKLDGFKFRRQHVIGPYIVDFCAVAYRFVVEVDGPIHEDEIQRRADALRDEYLRRHMLRVLRLRAELVESDLSEALALIRAALREA